MTITSCVFRREVISVIRVIRVTRVIITTEAVRVRVTWSKVIRVIRVIRVIHRTPKPKWSYQGLSRVIKGY